MDFTGKIPADAGFTPEEEDEVKDFVRGSFDIAHGDYIDEGKSVLGMDWKRRESIGRWNRLTLYKDGSLCDYSHELLFKVSTVKELIEKIKEHMFMSQVMDRLTKESYIGSLMENM